MDRFPLEADELAELERAIRVVPDYPKPGIDFFDITTLLKEPDQLRTALEGLSVLVDDLEVGKVAGIEARGFFFAPHLAHELDAGFVPIRKAGKLPSKASRESYQLEYGLAEMEIHDDAVRFNGERFLIVDDVLATGGTARAAKRLVEGLGGHVVAFAFLLEIEALNGREGLGAVRRLIGV